jgi:SPP1 family predicted phage head-tail adaptor
MICARELNKRITFQSQSSTQDSFGQPVDTWSDVATVWAGIITTGGKEFYAAQKLHAETTAVMKIRYRTDLLPTMRIKYGSRYFDILAINDVDEGHREMLITCKEVV